MSTYSVYISWKGDSLLIYISGRLVGHSYTHSCNYLLKITAKEELLENSSDEEKVEEIFFYLCNQISRNDFCNGKWEPGHCNKIQINYIASFYRNFLCTLPLS